MAVLVVHAGAGDRTQSVTELEAEYHAALIAALELGRSVLEPGGSALDAVLAAVAYMEDKVEHFNAGRGSVLCADGTVEMSASAMRGHDRAAGAVAGISRSRSPIEAANLVLESNHVLVIGHRADQLAAEGGIEQCDPSYFVTDHQRRRLAAAQGGGGGGAPADRSPQGGGGAPADRSPQGGDSAPDRPRQERDGATVGAVCLDTHGVLAAGTSTGGIRAQLPGRVGDTPIIGAGTWADLDVAVSCTGEGEAFIRTGVARQVAALVYGGMTLREATRRALEDVAEVGGSGGLIALDAGGVVSAPFLTEVMPRGVWRDGSESVVAIGPVAGLEI